MDDSCTESPVPGGDALTAVFARTQKEEVTVPYDAGAKVVGGIIDQTGQAISGATVCIQAQTQGSQLGFHPLGTATTDARGHFTYKVPAGPNREILVGYRHSFEVANAIRYRAHIKPTLAISRRQVQDGQAIELRGALPGRRADAARTGALALMISGVGSPIRAGSGPSPSSVERQVGRR